MESEKAGTRLKDQKKGNQVEGRHTERFKGGEKVVEEERMNKTSKMAQQK